MGTDAAKAGQVLRSGKREVNDRNIQWREAAADPLEIGQGEFVELRWRSPTDGCVDDLDGLDTGLDLGAQKTAGEIAEQVE